MPQGESLTSSISTAPATTAVVTVFVKLPRPGFVKTRLAAGVGAEKAAQFYRACAERTVDVICRCPGVECTVAYAPADAEEEIRAWLGGRGRQGNPPLRLMPQLDVPDLGARMRAALNEGLGISSGAAAAAAAAEQGAAAVSLVVGSDIPDLRPSDIRAAVDALSEAYFMKTAAVSGRGDKPPDCVLGPAADGGFWVVGVRRRRRNWSGEGEGSGGNASPSSLLLPDTLFEGITWSTSRVFAAAAASLKACGLELAPRETLRELADVDTIDNLVAWRRSRMREREGPSGGDESDGETWCSSSLASVVDEVLSS